MIGMFYGFSNSAKFKYNFGLRSDVQNVFIINKQNDSKTHDPFSC